MKLKLSKKKFPTARISFFRSGDLYTNLVSDLNIFLKNLESSIIENNLKNIELYNQFVGDENNNTTKTVDSLIYDHCKKIDLIKIDTDGTDLDCLKGCDKILKAFKPIIVIEINNNLEQIIKFLKQIGYKFFYDQYLKEIDQTKKIIVPNLFSSIYQLKI